MGTCRPTITTGHMAANWRAVRVEWAVCAIRPAGHRMASARHGITDRLAVVGPGQAGRVGCLLVVPILVPYPLLVAEQLGRQRRPVLGEVCEQVTELGDAGRGHRRR